MNSSTGGACVVGSMSIRSVILPVERRARRRRAWFSARLPSRCSSYVSSSSSISSVCRLPWTNCRSGALSPGTAICA